MKTKANKDQTPRLLRNGSRGEPTRDEVAQAAYYLWEQQGRPNNMDVGIWLKAESQLQQSRTLRAVQP